jgi:hypothetical protein
MVSGVAGGSLAALAAFTSLEASLLLFYPFYTWLVLEETTEVQ